MHVIVHVLHNRENIEICSAILTFTYILGLGLANDKTSLKNMHWCNMCFVFIQEQLICMQTEEY